MQSIVKKAVKIGNSSGVILPKSWQSKKVRVELLAPPIESDVFNILREQDLLKDVLGIYLVGSYARSEESESSDIDILVLTEKTNKSLSIEKYEILLISKEKLEKNLEKSIYLYSLTREAKPLLNKSLLEHYQSYKFKQDPKKIIKEIEDILDLHEETVSLASQNNKKVIDGIAYSLILRIRELLLLDCIKNNKRYSSKNLSKIIERAEAKESYKAYQRVKEDTKPKNNLSPRELQSLITIAKTLISDLRSN